MEKKELRLPALVVLGIYALYGCVLAPLYHYLITDIVLMDTLWLDVVDLLYSFAGILGTATLFGFLALSIYRHGLRGARPMLVLAGGAIVFKFLATVVAISIVNGSLNLTGGLNEYLFSLLLELTLVAFCVLLAHIWITPVTQHYRDRAAAAKVLGQQFEESDGCFPFTKLFSYANPLQRTVFWSLLILVLCQSAGFFIDFFSVPLPLQATDIPVMLIYWVLLILLPGVLGYLLSILLIKKAEKTRQ